MRCGVLHRLPVVTLAAALLYGGGYAFASEAVTAPAPAPPPLAAPAALPAATGEPTALRAGPAAAAQASSPAREAAPHIALLLPLDVPSFARHAEAVRAGFLAAAKVQGRGALPLRVYPVGEGERAAVEQYRRALGNDARLVVGPLTRSGVSAVAASALVMVPTIALNVPEHAVAGQRDLYVLSLHAESEARQVAHLAWQDGRHNAIVVYAPDALFRRIQRAFAEEFTRLGGKLVAEYAFSADQHELARLRQAVGLGLADMAFLALDSRRARAARPYLGAIELYATSHVYPGDATPLGGHDLANVRFLDMPWLLQPDHPAVMVYPRPDYRDPDLDRFYALGIDAFRVAHELLASGSVGVLDGVIGRLRLNADHQFSRTLTGAQFNGGKPRVTGEARDPR
ncbi:MAG: penicillin-binding protein activator [Burkholderiales bacterium]|nr:penicillin-binding protein activator [Burkholderiales bacterium]